MNIKFATGARNIRGLFNGENIGYTVTDLYTGVPSPVVTTVKDVATTVSTYYSTAPQCQLTMASNIDSLFPSFTSITPGICSVTPNGLVSRLADGVGIVEIASNTNKKRFSRDFTLGIQQSSAFNSYVVGSLAYHIWNNMINLVSGKIPSDLNLLNFSSYSGDYNTLTATRNVNNFAHSIDLSSMSVLRRDYSGGGNNGYWPATLISKRHFLCANHVTDSGTHPYNYIWMAPDGTQTKVTALTIDYIPNTDIAIGYLNQDMPSTLKICKVLPSNFRSYLPSTDNFWLPSLSKRMVVGDDTNVALNTPMYDALRVLSVKLLSTTDPGHASYAYVSQIGSIPVSPFSAWEVPLHNGDSSGPSWLVINGEAVLLGHYWNIGGCINVADYISQIEAKMATVAAANGDNTVYSLTKVSLAGFPTY